MLNKTDIFIKENKKIFNKFMPIKKIGEGSFGNVYLAKNLKENNYVAIKVEKKLHGTTFLNDEAFNLFTLKGLGIPEIISYGHIKKYSVLVEELLGKSLNQIFVEQNCSFKYKDLCLSAMQILDRLEFIHSKDMIHRDIKPENFLIGSNNPNLIYLIDFGLAKKYRSSKTGKHILPNNLKRITGTIRFCSLNALKGMEQSRRDDIESAGNMLVFLIKGKLPWQNVKAKTKREAVLQIIKIRQIITPEQLCMGLPKEIAEYIKYCRGLGFDEKPNYNYLRNLFDTLLKRFNIYSDIENFTWVTKGEFKKIKRPPNSNSRSSSPKQRLLKKIQNNLEIKKTAVEKRESSLNNVPNKFIETPLKQNNINWINSGSNSKSYIFNTIETNYEKSFGSNASCNKNHEENNELSNQKELNSIGNTRNINHEKIIIKNFNSQKELSNLNDNDFLTKTIEKNNHFDSNPINNDYLTSNNKEKNKINIENKIVKKKYILGTNNINNDSFSNSNNIVRKLDYKDNNIHKIINKNNNTSRNNNNNNNIVSKKIYIKKVFTSGTKVSFDKNRKNIKSSIFNNANRESTQNSENPQNDFLFSFNNKFLFLENENTIGKINE